jgi:hypothetical protein
MATYHIDLEASKAGGVMLVKLSGRAQAETIVKLLNELNALAERDSSVRVPIDETDLGAGFVGPSDIGRIAKAWQKAAALRAERVSVFNDRARARAWLLEG